MSSITAKESALLQRALHEYAERLEATADRTPDMRVEAIDARRLALYIASESYIQEQKNTRRALLTQRSPLRGAQLDASRFLPWRWLRMDAFQFGSFAAHAQALLYAVIFTAAILLLARFFER